MGDLTGNDNDHIPGQVLEAYGVAKTVLDPLAGRGLTSRSAHWNGWRSLNNELHPMRMSAAMHQLAQLTGATPERL